MRHLKKKDGIKAWHFVNGNKTLFCNSRMKAKEGRTHKITGMPTMCTEGFHGSKKLKDAREYKDIFSYGAKTLKCRVLLWGWVEEHCDKLVASRRTVLKIY